ncbi:MAG: hypothetical protein ACYDEN_14220 [Acidimicrobiales bacterium]
MDLVKLVVFVPEADAERVRTALGEAGAGYIGKYSFCSWSVGGVGRFRPEEGAVPHIGTVGELETVPEERIEVTCTRDHAGDIARTVRRVHPYEEVVIDVYPMLDPDDL